MAESYLNVNAGYPLTLPVDRNPMLYHELFQDFEQVRWSLAEDVPWTHFHAEALSESRRKR